MSDNVLEVDMTTLTLLAEPIMKQGFPLLIMGRHGIGKSEFVMQIASKLGMEVIEMRPSVMAEGDLSGLPFKGDEYTIHDGRTITSTRWSPPDWYLRACVKAVILFFDEADRGSMQVAQSLFQINDSRQLNGYRLHPETRIVACINGGRFGSLYQVREMDLAEFDRYAKIQLEPTVAEWLSWADTDNNVLSEMVSFFRNPENEKWLENTKNDIPEPGKIYPSRRSWTRYSKTLAEMPEFNKGFSTENQKLARQIGSTFIGVDAANSFVNHANSIVRVVTPELVFLKGRTDILETFTPMDHTDFMDRIFACDVLRGENLKKVKEEYITKYVKAIPAEQVPTFMLKIVTLNVNDLTTIQDTFKMFCETELTSYMEDLFFGSPLDLTKVEEGLKKTGEDDADDSL